MGNWELSLKQNRSIAEKSVSNCFLGVSGMPTHTNHQTNPFLLNELMLMSRLLKDVSLGLVNLAFPETRPTLRDFQGLETLTIAPEHTQLWSNLFKVTIAASLGQLLRLLRKLKLKRL